MSEVMVQGLFGYQRCRTQPNDMFYTPEQLAKEIVKYFKPSGKILEPCSGTGAFLKALPIETEWCEITKGKNFFDYHNKVDWIVTNPPFSKLTKFLEHSFRISNNVVFLINLAGLFTTKRIRIMNVNKFAMKEIRFVKQPETFVQCGRIPAAVHFKREYSGKTKMSYSKNWNTKFTKAK